MTGKSQTPANDTSTSTPAQAKTTKDATPKSGRGPVVSTKAKAATDKSVALASKDHSAAALAAGKKHRKAQPDQDKNSDPANTPTQQAPSTGTDSAAAVLATQTISTATQTDPAQDDSGSDDGAKAATPPDVTAASDTSLAALAPPIPASVLYGQHGTDGSDATRTGASPLLSQPNPPAGNSIAGGTAPASAQSPGQGGGDKDGDGTVAAGDEIKSKPAADGSSNPQAIAEAAAAAAQADLAEAAQKSGSGDSTSDSAEKKTGPASADLKSESGKSKSQDKSNSDPSVSADVLASALAMNPPASSQPLPAAGDDNAAPADTQKAPATTGPASSLPVAAQAPQTQTPADGKGPADPGSNQIPVAASEPGDKKDQSGNSSPATQDNAIKALATAMTGAQGTATTPAADSKAANQPGDTQPTASNHDGGGKPMQGTQPQSAAAQQPGLPAQIQPAIPQPLNVAPQTASAATVSAAMPGANPSGVATSVHIASAAANAVPNLDVLAISVAARSLSGAKQFDIRLDPPELGPVQVRLSIDASGKTQAHMTADQPQTLTLLQKDAPTLAQALRDAGLNVSQNGLNFSLRGQDRQDDARNGGAPARRTNLSATQISAAPAPAALSRTGAASQARVDIHV